MNSSNLLRGYFLLLFLTVLNFWGCSSSTSVPTQTSPPTHTLKRGDSFTFHDISYDTTGAVVQGSDSTVVSSVVSTGQTLNGMNNVTVLQGNSDSVLVLQIANDGIAKYQGSRSIFPGASVPGVWISVDTLTKNRVLVDSTMHGTISNAAASAHVTISSNYDGDTSVTVGTATGVKAHKFTKLITVVVTIPQFRFTSTTIVSVTSNYVPTIGYFTSIVDVDHSDSPMSPVPNYTNDQVLMGYQE